MTNTDVRQAQFLDSLYDYDRERPGQVPGVVDLLGERYDPNDEHVWRGIVRDLDYQGLIKLAETMGFDGTRAMITGSGRRDVEARRARRADFTQRNPLVRRAVIRYVYANSPAPDLTPMLETYHFEGEPLTRRDLDTALQYLLDKGLVHGVDVAEEILIHIRLTDRGIDCAENFGGSVGEFLNHERGGGGNTTVNFHGPVTGSNVAWNSREITQTATTTSSGLAGDELASLVGAIRQALPVLGLDNAEVTRLGGQLDVIEGELEGDEPDPGVVRSVMRRVLSKIGEVGETQLGLLLTVGTRRLLEEAGIPLGQ
ncbi:hypothetical protein [Dactylosporangium sp. NPDC005555]|uniref:hypothetical protein n=1 Tax=Dactylosporangium sp. NPDC005555 TaxID=3154889 RepID=UPI0033B46772